MENTLILMFHINAEAMFFYYLPNHQSELLHMIHPSFLWQH